MNKNKTNKNGAKSSAPVVFFTTFPNKKSASDFAHLAIKSRWAACINIIDNITSVYEWEGLLKDDQEFLVMGKTTKSAFKKLKIQLPTFHLYDVPELISFEIHDGLPLYFQWIQKMVQT